jgi:DNA-binding NarL/FixJ family response regulator
MAQITVLIADDHRILREGLRSLLVQSPGIRVVAEAENGRQAVELAERFQPQLVIIDVAMPELNGIEATRRIVAACPGVKVISLSMHEERQFILASLKAGATGYLLKDSAFDDLAEAILRVMQGQVYLSPAINAMVVQEFVQQISDVEYRACSPLSPREREVLQLLAEGYMSKEIALKMHLSVKTIEAHRQSIMEKLDLHSIAALTKYAIREGLTTLQHRA